MWLMCEYAASAAKIDCSVEQLLVPFGGWPIHPYFYLAVLENYSDQGVCRFQQEKHDKKKVLLSDEKNSQVRITQLGE